MTNRGKQVQRASRERRLDAALRENLRRRKAQARGREAAGEREAEGEDAVRPVPGREPAGGENDKS